MSEAESYTQEFNNHHLCYTARLFGRFVLFQTLRDLDSMQIVMPVTAHNLTHIRYAPPEFPTPYEAMDYVVEAYETHQPLKLGSIGKPRYELIKEPRMQHIMQEYNNLTR